MPFRTREVARLLVETGRRCAICRSLHNVQVHHIRPRALGGTDDIENAIPLCPNCHNEVHGSYALGRVTRRYTEAELREHLRRARELAAVLPSADRHGVPNTAQTGLPEPLWNAPHPINPHFHGRTSILDRLDRAAHQDGIATLALVGLGGEGKTQIAIEHTHRAAAWVDLIWWLRAERPEVLLDDYAALCATLGITVGDRPSTAELARAVTARLARGDLRWLLVFDNVRSPEDVLPLLPSRGQGEVLLTSQDQRCSRIAELISVESFRPDEAIEFLLRRTMRDDRNGAGLLNERLGGLALALEQAAAFVYASGLPFLDYVQLLEDRGISAMRGKSVFGYPHTVATVWAASLATAEADHPLAMTIARWCGFLYAEGIPRRLVADGVAETAGADALAVAEATARLAELSLIRIGEDVLTMHRLVQSYLREEAQEHAPELLREILLVLDSTFPPDPEEPLVWPACDQLLPHVLAATSHARSADVSPRVRAHLLDRCGIYLNARASHAAAETVLAEAAETLGADDDSSAERGRVLTHLARAERNLGRLSDAHEHATAAVTTLRRAGDETETRFALSDALSMLGRVLFDQRDLEQALWVLNDAQELLAGVKDAPPAQLNGLLNQLGRVLRDMGEYTRAEQVLREALERDEATFGPHHPRTAWTLDNLGTVLNALGRNDDAEALLTRALRIEESVNGPQHPRVAWTLANLAAVARDQGSPDAASALLTRALAIETRAYGIDNPRTASTAASLDALEVSRDDAEPGRW